MTPRLGHFPALIRELEGQYLKARLTNKMATFETEYLCRWVVSMREPLVSPDTWARCEGTLEEPERPYMGVSMDPSGKRASAYLAWRHADGTVALRKLVEGTGDPIDPDKLGSRLRDLHREHKARVAGFDPMTDAALSRYLPRSKPITGQAYANASARFVTLVDAGQLRWQDCAAVTGDLTWTTRKAHDEKGAFEAVRASDDRPITAALAAIRAVWLASEPPRTPRKPRTPVGF
jgi:hypothetical protein